MTSQRGGCVLCVERRPPAYRYHSVAVATFQRAVGIQTDPQKENNDAEQCGHCPEMAQPFKIGSPPSPPSPPLPFTPVCTHSQPTNDRRSTGASCHSRESFCGCGRVTLLKPRFGRPAAVTGVPRRSGLRANEVGAGEGKRINERAERERVDEWVRVVHWSQWVVLRCRFRLLSYLMASCWRGMEWKELHSIVLGYTDETKIVYGCRRISNHCLDTHIHIKLSVLE